MRPAETGRCAVGHETGGARPATRASDALHITRLSCALIAASPELKPEPLTRTAFRAIREMLRGHEAERFV
jgi:hypothetical protein